MRPIALFLLLGFVHANAQLGPSRGVYYTERFNDSTFVDLIEVRVADWIDFMQNGGGTAPDSVALRGTPYAYLFADPGNEPIRAVRGVSLYSLVRINLRADSLHTRSQRNRCRTYASYPIAGISQNQALAYCAWRTHRYNEVERRWRDSSWTVAFELPHIREMEALLAPADSSNGKCPTFNYNCLPCHSEAEPHPFIRPGEGPVPADSYLPDSHRLYQLRGNVAEMTSSPGVAMGGSYRDPAHACEAGRKQTYTKPEPWLGFRCVARIKAR